MILTYSFSIRVNLYLIVKPIGVLVKYLSDKDAVELD